MERNNEKLAKQGIQIQNFTPDVEEIATQMNREERYTVRAALRMGLRAPFLHILAACWIMVFWKALAIDLPIAFIIGYSCAVVIFLLMTHALLTTKITNYGHIGEVYSEDRGMVWVAMDVTKEPPYIVGMAGIKPMSPTMAEMVKYMVRSPYQGRGIGSALMDAVLQFAADMDYAAIEAETWDISAEFKVFPIYRRLGFHKHSTGWAPSNWLPMFKSEFLIKDLK